MGNCKQCMHRDTDRERERVDCFEDLYTFWCMRSSTLKPDIHVDLKATNVYLLSHTSGTGGGGGCMGELTERVLKFGLFKDESKGG